MRPCGPLSASSTAVGRCLGSELMAKPNRMSCISGMPIIIPKVSRSRRIWTNSLTTIAQNRAGENMRRLMAHDVGPSRGPAPSGG